MRFDIEPKQSEEERAVPVTPSLASPGGAFPSNLAVVLAVMAEKEDSDTPTLQEIHDPVVELLGEDSSVAKVLRRQANLRLTHHADDLLHGMLLLRHHDPIPSLQQI